MACDFPDSRVDSRVEHYIHIDQGSIQQKKPDLAHSSSSRRRLECWRYLVTCQYCILRDC